MLFWSQSAMGFAPRIAMVVLSTSVLSGCGESDAEPPSPTPPVDAGTEQADQQSDSQSEETSIESEPSPEASTEAQVDSPAEAALPTWEERIAKFWGEAPDQATRLELFDDFWGELAREYGAFVTCSVKWDQIRDTYRPRVEAAKSYGEFYRALSEIFEQLQDLHTRIRSQRICDTSKQSERPPVIWKNHLVSLLGACTTVVDDKMLVVRVDDDNPAKLAPGDIILGYDGVPWRTLLAKTDEWKLPICGSYAPNKVAFDNLLMDSVVNNAHLFEQLDVVRGGKTEIEHIPTEGLLTHTSQLICAPQVAVAGVSFPWLRLTDPKATQGKDVSSGIVTGTNVGYIYVYDWGASSHADFTQAVKSLLGTDGLIIDFRFNLGGSSTEALEGLGLLFGDDLKDVYNAFLRGSETDYYDMVPAYPGQYDILGKGNTPYTKPIAVLSGPRAGSAGDGVTYLMSLHPKAKRFGRPSGGGFGFLSEYWSPTDPYINDFLVTYTPGILKDKNGKWLHAAEQTLDEPVWLTQEDVRAGVDTVVQAALAWIQSSPK